jgi:DNA excision repair protein ERCC-6
MDEASVLKDLTEGVRNQEDLQRDISHQANLLIIEQEDERDKKRIDKVTGSKDKLLAQKQTHERRLNAILPNTPQSKHIQNEIDKIDSEIADLDGDILQIQERIAQRHKHDGEVEDAAHDIAGNRRLPNESHRDFLIRTGKITPFARMPDREADTAGGALTDVLMDAEDEANLDEEVKEAGPQSHQNLRLPGFVEAPDGSSAATSESEQATRSRKKRRMHDGSAKNSDAESPYTPAESEDIELGEDEYEDDEERPRKRAIKGKSKANDDVEDLTKIDDGNEKMYQSRLKSWIERRSRARRNRHLISGEQGSGHSANENIEDDEEEWFKPSPDAPDHEFENGLKVPGDIYPALFDYQKTGVQWLGELYEQQVGGIVGDEMGLGKTLVFLV